MDKALTEVVTASTSTKPKDIRNSINKVIAASFAAHWVPNLVSWFYAVQSWKSLVDLLVCFINGMFRYPCSSSFIVFIHFPIMTCI
jgi:hypothetical protein